MEEIFKLYRELRVLVGEKDFREEFCQQIYGIIQETIDQIPGGTRIAIRPAGEETRRMLESFDFNRKNVIGIVDKNYRGKNYCGYPSYTVDSFPAESCDYVIISSHRYRQAIKKELEMRHTPYIDFYDELEKRGIQLPVPYFICESYSQPVLNHFYLRYLRTEAGTQREIVLNALLQIAVECKEFTLISNIYQDCGGEDGEFPILKTVWKKSKHLLDCIRNKLQERTQKDIILFWTDSVPYNRFHYLPETMELSKQGTFFQRAYTTTPHTNAVLRSMFRNVLPIDDFPKTQEKIDSENSPLIQFMENEGYKVRFIGDSKRVMGREHLLEVSEKQSCNVKWWEGVIDLLQSPEPCFYIFHFMESHFGSYVPGLKGPVTRHNTPQAQWEVQIKTTFGYLDQCLALYHKLLGEKTQIFFSDHGQKVGYKNMRWDEQVMHPYCFAVGKDIPKIIVTRFFPYINFGKFIQWIVDSTIFALEDVCADEIAFQDTDYYNPWKIDAVIEADNAKFGIAYRGILNYEYKYVINSLGEEFFYRVQPDSSEELVPLEDPALRAELRNKAGTKFLDIYQYDKFLYSRKLYESIDQKGRGGNAN